MPGTCPAPVGPSRRWGFRVIPAGTRFHRTQDTLATDWLPDAQALLDSHFAFHEWLGLAWYRLRGRFG
jgi:uncharacterized SAM-binding protein YcdF (DUF218 family)